MRRSEAERRAWLEQQAALMAANPTEAERALYEIVEPLGFKRQQVLLGSTKNGLAWSYIADSLHHELKLIVEVDGSSHDKRKGRDRRRDTRLRGEGIKTIRIKNSDVFKWPDTIRETIERIVRLG